MVRVHRILTPDATPFLHDHPFGYLSLVVRGGYTEQVRTASGELLTIRHRAGALIFRSAGTAHRITTVAPGCLTLFFAWHLRKPGQGWSLYRHAEVTAPDEYQDWPDGLYRHRDGYRKRAGGIWYTWAGTEADALRAERISIHQQLGDVSLVK